MPNWEVVYEKAIRDDGSLYFPERLSKKFLEDRRQSQGSYIFANQYQNQIIPEDEKKFKQHWIRYYKSIPEPTHTFGFIDPAIGQKRHNDYTGITVVHVDTNGYWYLCLAARYRLTPTEIVNKMFQLCEEFKLQTLGVENVAYQEALLYMCSEEMRKRRQIIPVKGITRNSISKQTRILALVPRFEWGRLMLAQGMTDFEDEYNSFPRGSHDDILDSLASLEEIVYYPTLKEKKLEQPDSQNHPDYEKWYIDSLHKQAAGRNDYHESETELF